MIRKEMIAKRYAQAFFEMVKKDLEENKRKMEDIASIINKNPEIIKILSNPAISNAKKKEIIKSCFLPTDELLYFLLLLIERGRLKIFPLILMFFNKLVDREMKRIRVILRSPFPVRDVIKEKLIEKLKNIYKMDIILDVKIEPELIGGAILQIGSKKIDGSISGYLKRMEEIWQK